MSDPQIAAQPWPVAPEADSPTEQGSGPPQPPPTPRQRRYRKSDRSGLRSLIEWAVILGVALVGALLIRAVLFQAFFIPSASMDPTLKVHDRILVNKLSYHVHGVHRGDIVVFKRGKNFPISEGNIKDLVKRVIGLPGETIQSTPEGQVEINGQVLSEKYLPPGTQLGPPIPKTVIPAGHYFVMGDNRSDSQDSRFFGAIPGNLIVGRAFILIWPLSDFRLL